MPASIPDIIVFCVDQYYRLRTGQPVLARAFAGVIFQAETLTANATESSEMTGPEDRMVHWLYAPHERAEMKHACRLVREHFQIELPQRRAGLA
jgi:hypothetical protein